MSKEENVLSANRKSTNYFLAKCEAIIPPIDRPCAPNFYPIAVLYLQYRATNSESSFTNFGVGLPSLKPNPL
jgi:hypothetical protein